MSEGTAREIVMKAMADFVNSLVDTSDPAFRYTPEQFDKEADAVLAALHEAGALAPAGMTERAKRIEREANAVVDAVSLLIEYKQENGYWNDTEMDLAAAAEKHLDALHEALESADAATGEPS